MVPTQLCSQSLPSSCAHSLYPVVPIEGFHPPVPTDNPHPAVPRTSPPSCAQDGSHSAVSIWSLPRCAWEMCLLGQGANCKFGCGGVVDPPHKHAGRRVCTCLRGVLCPWSCSLLVESTLRNEPGGREGVQGSCISTTQCLWPGAPSAGSSTRITAHYTTLQVRGAEGWALAWPPGACLQWAGGYSKQLRLGQSPLPPP